LKKYQMKTTNCLRADYFLNKQREKAKLEAEMKMSCTMRQTIPAWESREFAPCQVFWVNIIYQYKNFIKSLIVE